MTQIDASEPTPEAVALTRRMDRSDAFRAAYTLARSLDWGGYQPDVIDVLRVAEFLTEGEDD
ncbi:hypothetical protein [Streptomyces californicus]|uniref:hypothetical protein n=1 Tax=Streptomyces californicus TaxID=67351 RepID=UPI0004BFDD73|nr:hypothetical protein [Streptomyces californicus]QRV53487.1 hypothetical protein I6J40_04200 [Streptomyces californicus]